MKFNKKLTTSVHTHTEQVCGTHPFSYVCHATNSSECEAMRTCGLASRCPEGYQHETLLLHLANCAQPVIFIPILSGLMIGLGVLAQGMLVYRLKAQQHVNRGSALVVLAGAQCANAGVVGMSVARWIQGYSSPSYWFFIGVAATSISVSLTMTIVAFARIVYKLAAVPFPQATFRLAFISSVGTLSFPFWFVFFPASFVEDAVVYNTMLAVGVLVIPMQLLVTGPILFIATTRLRNNIEDVMEKTSRALSNAEESNVKLINLLARISFFRRAMMVIVPLELGFITLISLMYFIWRVSVCLAWPCLPRCVCVCVCECDSAFCTPL